MTTITVQDAARRAARLAMNEPGSTIDGEYPLTEGFWHFTTSGHGYIAGVIPGLHRSVAAVLDADPFIAFDRATGAVAGEEDCSWMPVIWTACVLYDVPMPESVSVTQLAEGCERWYPGMIDRLGVARAAV